MPRLLSLWLNLCMLTLSLLRLRRIAILFRPLKGLLSLSPLITFGTISNEMSKGMAIMTLIRTTSDSEYLFLNHFLPFKIEKIWKALRRGGSHLNRRCDRFHIYGI